MTTAEGTHTSYNIIKSTSRIHHGDKTSSRYVHTCLDFNLLKIIGEHNHPSDSTKVNSTMEVRMTMKKEALTSQHPTSVVLADNLGRLSEAALPKMMSLSRKVQIWRRKELDAPPNPLGWANFDVPLDIRDFEGED